MAGMTSNGDASWFGGMLVLPIATFCRHAIPTLCFNQFDNIPNFHNSQSLVVTIACAAPGIGVGVAAKSAAEEEKQRVRVMTRTEKVRSLGKQIVIFGMRAYPEPGDACWLFYTERSVVRANAYRP